MNSPFTTDALADRRALVTGSSRGIGAAIATAFAGAGAEVYLAADDKDGLEHTREAIVSAGGRAHAIVVDLTDQESISDLVQQCAGVDILVNNAAPDQRPYPLLETPESLWDTMFALNFWAPLALIRKLAPAMMDAGAGCIISISSVSVRNPAPRIAPYAASKAALELLTKVAALEFAASGVRVNAIAPSMVRTQRIRALLDDPAFEASAKARIPMGRLAETSDVAGAAVWLASDAASFVTGQVISVEGGSSVGTYNHVPPRATSPD